MLKKMFIIGGVGVLLLVLLFGRSTVSYIRTSAGYVSNAAQESVPIEFQIDRARGMIKDLVPEVRKNMQVIAKEEVEVKKLEEQIAQTQTRLAKEKEQLLRLKADLASGRSNFTYASRSYTVEQVKTDMANRFERYKTSEATLASLQQMQTARQQSLEAARQKLEGMLAAKRQLAVEVENLEARLQMVAAAQTTSAYQFDDSRLGQAKELIANLRTRLDVAEKLANAETKYQGEIQLEGTSPANIVEEVTEHFAGSDNATKLAASSKE
jgi:peptidoglycan hydrolase CwlO-like protein